MADDLSGLSAAEKALIEKHRAEARGSRKVRVHGEHNGTKYEFDVEGDEAAAIIGRHADLFKPDDQGAGDKGDGKRRGILG